MFFHFLTLIALSIVASVAGAPTDGPASANVARADPHPVTELKFRSYIVVDLVELREITVPEGTRVNVDILGGNWTSPDGSLLANIVGGLGGEHGYIDSTGVFHLDVRYTVQFAADNKWGYVQMTGFGIAAVRNKAFITLESDSVAATGLIEQTLYAPGHFVGDVLVAPHWAFV